MNVKKRQQGLGYYQVEEQLRSEVSIIEYLVYLNDKDEKADPNDMPRPNWVSIRGLVRVTGLHHVTVSKAIERLKHRGSIIEVHGRRNSRLFCISDGVKADYIRKHLSKSTMIRSLNNPHILRDPEFHQWNRKQRWVLDKYRKKHDNEITLEMQEYNNILWKAVSDKRLAISRANRLRWHDSKGKRSYT